MFSWHHRDHWTNADSWPERGPISQLKKQNNFVGENITTGEQKKKCIPPPTPSHEKRTFLALLYANQNTSCGSKRKCLEYFIDIVKCLSSSCCCPCVPVWWWSLAMLIVRASQAELLFSRLLLVNWASDVGTRWQLKALWKLVDLCLLCAFKGPWHSIYCAHFAPLQTLGLNNYIGFGLSVNPL